MQGLLESQLPLVLKASWQAAVLILLVLVIQWALGRRLSPRWRYGLWLLVVLRLALPWTIPSALSLYNFLNFERHLRVAVDRPAPVSSTVEAAAAPVAAETASGVTPGAPEAAPATAGAAGLGLWWILIVWSGGALVLAVCLGLTHFRLARRVTPCRPLIDAPVMNLLEDCKQAMGVRVPISLVETSAVDSPSLFGFLRPRLLLPMGLTRGFSPAELRYVFLHELGHIKRLDILAGWVFTALQVLHWFNPLVWLAFHRMRVDRELACDALALSYARDEENQAYGRTIIKLLENFGGSAWAPSLAGTVEDKNQIKERIRMIAKFKKTNRAPALAVILFAALGLVTLTDAQTGQKRAAGGQGAGPGGGGGQGSPRIVETTPEVGATDVDPGLTEITVTFDRDMAGGFSWTGGGPDYPKAPEGAKAQWRDKRTCVLPVKLESAHYYRVGINSPSFRNFRSAAGVPAAPSAIYFTTKGASEDLKKQMSPPKIVSTSPKVGATEVDPGLAEITVTFDQDMGGGFSWTGGGPEYPASPEGAKAQWRDKRTCVMPVKLEAGRYYRVGINSTSFQNFSNARGIPARPSAIFFTTVGASEDLKAKTRLPQVVKFNPPNGAQKVSPALTELRVTFDVPMGGGFSWTGGGPEYPKGREGQRPRWIDGGKTCVLPVTLEPDSQYEIGLNSEWHKNFQSVAGVPLEPVVYKFKTGQK